MQQDKPKTSLFSRRSIGASALAASLFSIASSAKSKDAASSKSEGISSPLDYGAAGDGVTDDSDAINTALLSTDILHGAKSKASFLSATIKIKSWTRLLLINITGKSENKSLIELTQNTEGFQAIGTNISAPTGSAIHQNSENNRDIQIIGGKIKAYGYAILSNKNSSGSDGMQVIGSSIESSTSDAIEWNHPKRDSYNYLAIGNILQASSGAKGNTAGFAIGIAGTQGHITLGNHIRESRNSAIHIEGGQQRGIIIGNTAQKCLQNGTTVQTQPNNAGDGVVYIGNQLKHEGTRSNNGFWVIHDKRGSASLNVISGNRNRNFSTGFTIDGSSVQCGSDNISIQCDVGVKASGGAKALGTWYSSETSILAKLGGKAIIGKLISDTIPTEILEATGENAPGAYAKGFLIPFEIEYTTSKQVFYICKLPTRMAGRITITIGTKNFGLMISCEILWDGESLITKDILIDAIGKFSAMKMVADNKNLSISFSHATEFKSIGQADFDGIYYQR